MLIRMADDMDDKIFHAYLQANVFVSDAFDDGGELIYEYLWLGAMGMMETLEIMGIKADTYD